MGAHHFAAISSETRALSNWKLLAMEGEWEDFLSVFFSEFDKSSPRYASDLKYSYLVFIPFYFQLLWREYFYVGLLNHIFIYLTITFYSVMILTTILTSEIN